MKDYDRGLRYHGKLLLSGFYQKDLAAIIARATECGFVYEADGVLNDWAVVLLHK